MNIACPAAVFEADIGAINGFRSGDTHARQGSHSASLWGSGWGKGSASPTRLSRREGKPGRQQRGQGNRTRPQKEGWTEMSQDIVKAMDDLYGNVSFGGGKKGSGGGSKGGSASKSSGPSWEKTGRNSPSKNSWGTDYYNCITSGGPQSSSNDNDTWNRMVGCGISTTISRW